MYKSVNVCKTLLTDGEFITKTYKAMALGFPETRYFIGRNEMLHENDLSDSNIAAKLTGYTWCIWHFESKTDLAKNKLIRAMEDYVAFKKKEVKKAIGEIEKTTSLLEVARSNIRKKIQNE